MTKLMMRTLGLAILMLPSCKISPTSTVSFPGPTPNIVYTVETWEQAGAASSDFTRVSASFIHRGETDRQVFLDGAYLNVTDIRWLGNNEVTVCLSGGTVHSLKKKLVLYAAGTSYTMNSSVSYFCSVYK